MKAWRASDSFCTPHSLSERSSRLSGPVGLNLSYNRRPALFNSCFYEHLSSGMISEKEKKMMDWALIRLICAIRLMVIQ